MEHNFAQVPRADIPRNTFNLSHGVKTTFDADFLVPMGVWDVIPGDSWNVKTTILARLATPLRPLMDNLYIDTFYFFVPYRILWDNFEKFMGAQDDPADTIAFTIPITEADDTVLTGDLCEYMGVPIGLNPSHLTFSVLPFRAYRLIWNDWFRDENLQDSAIVKTDNGPDNNTNRQRQTRRTNRIRRSSRTKWIHKKLRRTRSNISPAKRTRRYNLQPGTRPILEQIHQI